MRYLLASLALLACASDPDAPAPYAGTNDASVAQCPHVGEPGYTGASQFSDGRCAYRCASTHRRCGTVIPDDGGSTEYGLCVPYSDPQNCGLCGTRCEQGTSCRIVSSSRGQYVCVAPGVT